jgi:hypothetical protein
MRTFMGVCGYLVDDFPVNGPGGCFFRPDDFVRVECLLRCRDRLPDCAVVCRGISVSEVVCLDLGRVATDGFLN